MPTIRRLAVLAALFVCTTPCSQDASADMLEWLEPPQDPKALEWARQQTVAARLALASLPVSGTVAAELDAALKTAAPVPDLTLLGAKAVRLLRDAERPRGVLQVAVRRRDGRLGDWRDVLSATSLREPGAAPLELKWGGEWDRPRDACLPPAYERCMLRLSIGGSDEADLREFDLATGSFVTGGFRLPASFSQVAWLNRDALLVTHTLGTSPRTAAGLGAAVYLWRRGQPIEAAREVVRADPGDAEIRPMALGTGQARQGVIVRSIDYSNFELSLVSQSGTMVKVPLPRNVRPLGVLATTDRHLVVQLTATGEVNGLKVPTGTVLSYDVSPRVAPKRRLQVVYTPEPDEYLADVFHGFEATRSQIHFVVTRNLLGRIVTATPVAKGWTTQSAPATSPGVSQFLVAANPATEELVVRTSGFLSPDRLEIWRAGRPPLLAGEEPAAFDASRFTVEVRSATAQDGTSIDYFLVRPRTPASSGATPTLMTGYGAFGVSVPPAYLDSWVGGRAFKLWLERGGALVLPAIRGGGERGSAWHRAAMRENRQVSYDDFYAVAESLMASGFTDPRHLGVFGASNGGLLAAVAGTQRPDLFSAVVGDVPLTDMLRFPRLGMGALWIDEYGDPADPAMARVLRSYSPLHNVSDGRSYPPFLVTISTRDDRAGPGHGRKLVARLQEAGATAWLIEDEQGGHSVSDALGNPGVLALRMAFLIDHLMPAPTH
jgi:prolyl oligopeptidase